MRWSSGPTALLGEEGHCVEGGPEANGEVPAPGAGGHP